MFGGTEVFGVTDGVQVLVIAESFFVGLKAEVGITPVMRLEAGGAAEGASRRPGCTAGAP
ncbi:hypothetical protein GCM10010389_25920 [Streptomyces echinoruber]|uniref:Uncharacterized protein n=1 Tax=Streptomyces echinoruber TaxID=68898 RepID=A0A918R5R6_9ACTN|nr:hypothetical protein GCM10010389_25920 [Streptomyces echinoruber]